MDVMMRRRELMGMQGKLKTVSGPIVTVNDAMSRNAKSLIVNFAPIQASGTPAPDNVLPISGWTGVTGYRTGVNLCDIGNPLFTAPKESQFISYNSYINNGFLMNGGVVGKANGSGLTFSAVAGCNYIISFTPGGESANYVIAAVNIGSNNTWLNKAYVLFQETTVGQRKCITFTFPSGYTHIYFAGFSATKYGSWESDIQLEVGTTPTPYSPYTGTTYPVDWTDIAGTVYGGYVELVSGVVVVDRAGFNAKNVTWTDAGSGRVYTNLSQSPTNLTSPLCSHCEYHRRPAAGAYDNWIDWGGYPDSNKNLLVTLKDITTTLSTWQTYIQNNDVEFVYELATPVTYQLTPPQTIAMLRGTNNVWSNANGNTELTYYAQ